MGIFTSLYLFIVPLLLVCIYILTRYFLLRAQLENFGKNAFIDANEFPNNFEIAKENIFMFLDDTKDTSKKNFKIFFHFLLHFFVLFLKFISDVTDILYAKSRDFFLKTATKEKDAVAKFWPHLKEYKKESEAEKEEENK